MLKINSKAAHPVSKVIFQRLALIVRFVLLGLFVLLILGCQTAESPAEISQEPTATSQTILTNPPEDSITPKPTATSEPLPTAMSKRIKLLPCSRLFKAKWETWEH